MHCKHTNVLQIHTTQPKIETNKTKQVPEDTSAEDVLDILVIVCDS